VRENGSLQVTLIKPLVCLSSQKDLKADDDQIEWILSTDMIALSFNFSYLRMKSLANEVCYKISDKGRQCSGHSWKNTQHREAGLNGTVCLSGDKVEYLYRRDMLLSDVLSSGI